MVEAEFFDIFGIFVFIIVLAIGIMIKVKRRKLPNNVWDWIAIILIVIGFLGLLVDLWIVVKTFLV